MREKLVWIGASVVLIWSAGLLHDSDVHVLMLILAGWCFGEAIKCRGQS